MLGMQSAIVSNRIGWTQTVISGLAGVTVEPNARIRCTVDLSCQSPTATNQARYGPEPFFHG